MGVHRLLRNTLMFNCQKSTPYCIKHLTYWHCKFHFSISSSLVLPSFHLFTMHLYVTTPGFELCVLQSSRDASDLKYSFVDIDNSGNLYPCMWELMFFFSKKKYKKVVTSIEYSVKNLGNDRYGVNTVRFSKNFPFPLQNKRQLLDEAEATHLFRLRNFIRSLLKAPLLFLGLGSLFLSFGLFVYSFFHAAKRCVVPLTR